MKPTTEDTLIHYSLELEATPVQDIPALELINGKSEKLRIKREAKDCLANIKEIFLAEITVLSGYASKGEISFSLTLTPEQGFFRSLLPTRFEFSGVMGRKGQSLYRMTFIYAYSNSSGEKVKNQILGFKKYFFDDIPIYADPLSSPPPPSDPPGYTYASEMDSTRKSPAERHRDK